MKEFGNISKDLLARVAAGDQQSFKQLHEQCRTDIKKHVLLFNPDSLFADDTVQEILLKIWQKKEVLEKVENFRGWLFSLTRNHLLDQARKKQREQIKWKDYLAHYHQFWPPQENEIPDSHFILQQSIRQIPLRQRQALVLIKGMGCTRRETAELLGISENAVKFNIKMAMRCVKKLAYFQNL